MFPQLRFPIYYCTAHTFRDWHVLKFSVEHHLRYLVYFVTSFHQVETTLLTCAVHRKKSKSINYSSACNTFTLEHLCEHDIDMQGCDGRLCSSKSHVHSALRHHMKHEGFSLVFTHSCSGVGPLRVLLNLLTTRLECELEMNISFTVSSRNK